MNAVECLNAAFAADPAAIHALRVNRVPCNQALADDPFVVIEYCPVLPVGVFQVGAPGLINGVLTASGLSPVAAVFDDVPGEDGTKKMRGFCEYKPTSA